MTSVISRADVESACWLAGVKDPVKMDRLLRVVDLYAFAIARKMNGIMEAEDLYLCHGCNELRDIADFPKAKQDDPSIDMSCRKCQDKRKYTCTACKVPKPLYEFPESKQNNPRERSACLICEPQVITRKDADYVR